MFFTDPQLQTSYEYTEMLQYKYDSLGYSWWIFLEKLSINSKTTFLQYMVLTES